MQSASLPDLQAFAAVARLRSFRRAAVELGVSPSALSHTLRGLESRLAVRLLNRTTRSVAPTEAGERLLKRIAQPLSDIHSAIDEVNAYRDSPHGRLLINAPRAACELVLAPLVARFVSEHPSMHVELVAEDALVDIVDAGFDAGVRFGERLQQDMVAVPIGPRQRFVVVGSPQYLAEHGAPRCPRELAKHRCVRIRFSDGSLYRWEFSRGEERLAVDVEGSVTVGDMHLMIHAAESGLGLAYVYTQYAAPGLSEGRLHSVLDEWRPYEPGFFLYYPSRRLVPAGLRAFIDLAKRSLQPDHLVE